MIGTGVGAAAVTSVGTLDTGVGFVCGFTGASRIMFSSWIAGIEMARFALHVAEERIDHNGNQRDASGKENNQSAAASCRRPSKKLYQP